MCCTQEVKIEDVGTGLVYITISVPRDNRQPQEVASKTFREIEAFLQSSKAEIVQERLYGNREVSEQVLEGRMAGLGCQRVRDLPEPTYIEGRPVWGTGFAGAHILAAVPGGMSGCSVSALRYEGKVCGRLLRRFDAEFLFFSDVGRILRVDPKSPRIEQARQILEGMAYLVGREGLGLGNVIRTWFYLDNILDWYGDFNGERNRVYSEAGLFGFGERNRLPASTGIEGKSPTGLACTLDLMAVRSEREDYPEICRLSNPRQNEAFHYGSAFARGAYLREQCLTHIYVSGTAAIDEHGESLGTGDMDAQVERTMVNVRELLAQAGLGIPHMRHMTVFFKPGSDTSAYERVCRRFNLPDMPVVSVLADVCRPDLLFEIDGEAAALL